MDFNFFKDLTITLLNLILFLLLKLQCGPIYQILTPFFNSIFHFRYQMLWTKWLRYHNKLEVYTMYTNVSMEHNSKIDKRDKLQNNSLKNKRTSSKYPNTFIHHNSHLSIMNTWSICIPIHTHTWVPFIIRSTLLPIDLHITCIFIPIYVPPWYHIIYI